MKPKSYKILTGVFGLSTGLLSVVLSYIAWNILNSCSGMNKIKSLLVDSTPIPENSFEEQEIEHEKEKQKDKKESIKQTHSGCRCFVDHSGYDHFQRFDEKLTYKFRFHKHRGDCRQLNMSNSTLSENSLSAEC